MKYLSGLIQREKELDEGMKKASMALKNPVTGNLDILKQGNCYRYYKILNQEEDGLRKKIYLKRKEEKQAASIARRDYANSFIKCASKEKRLINQLLKLQENNVERVYEKLHPGRKQLVKPFVMTDDEYEEKWKEVHCKSKNKYLIMGEIYTENQEHVRSKSEKIIADKLKLEGISYKYEEALILGGRVVFPDFTILNKSLRKIFYWEHFGMIDQAEYQENMLKKLEIYSKHQIVSGSNLIVTFETKDHPLSVKQVETIIKASFLTES